MSKKRILAMGAELENMTGRRVRQAQVSPGGKPGVIRFDFTSGLHRSIGDDLRKRGLQSRIEGKSLFVWTDRSIKK